MTDISVYSRSTQVENLSWDLTPPHGAFDQNGTLAVGAFTQAQHYPNGFIPSGCVLALATGGANAGLMVPYLAGGANGAGVAAGYLKASVNVVGPSGPKVKVGCAYRVHGIVSKSHLPFKTAADAAAGGFPDAAAQTALPLIYVAA